MNYYAKFVEHNSNEGETWNYFFPYKKRTINKLKKLVEDLGETENKYEITEGKFSEHVVDIMVEHGNNLNYGYMEPFQKLSAIALPDDLIADAENDPFNKGGLLEYQELTNEAEAEVEPVDVTDELELVEV